MNQRNGDRPERADGGVSDGTREADRQQNRPARAAQADRIAGVLSGLDFDSGVEEEFEPGSESGSESAAEPGSDLGPEPTAEPGSDPVTESGSELGSEPATEPGSESDSESGSESDSESDEGPDSRLPEVGLQAGPEHPEPAQGSDEGPDTEPDVEQGSGRGADAESGPDAEPESALGSEPDSEPDSGLGAERLQDTDQTPEPVDHVDAVVRGLAAGRDSQENLVRTLASAEVLVFLGPDGEPEVSETPDGGAAVPISSANVALDGESAPAHIRWPVAALLDWIGDGPDLYYLSPSAPVALVVEAELLRTAVTAVRAEFAAVAAAAAVTAATGEDDPWRARDEESDRGDGAA